MRSLQAAAVAALSSVLLISMTGAADAAGCAWSVPSVNAPGTNDNLIGVSALTASDAWAFGGYDYAPNKPGPLAMHWNGSSWSGSSTAIPNALRSGFAAGVELAPDDVWGVGSEYETITQPLAEHWDGTAWSIVPMQIPSAGALIYGIAAVSANDVWAVGVETTETSRNLAEHWDGSSWRIVRTPNVGSDADYLIAVTAVSTNDVWAVGEVKNQHGRTKTLALNWNGSRWTIVPPQSPGNGFDYLSGAAAVSADQVFAVGGRYELPRGGLGTLAEVWNGTQWQVEPSGDETNTVTFFQAVAASTTGAALAVGVAEPLAPPIVPFAAAWNGTRWKPTLPILQNGQDGFFAGASAIPKSRSFWAVGTGYTSGVAMPLIENYSCT